MRLVQHRWSTVLSLSVLLLLSTVCVYAQNTLEPFVNPVSKPNRIQAPVEGLNVSPRPLEQTAQLFPPDLLLPPDQTAWRYLAERDFWRSNRTDVPFLPQATLTQAEWITLLYRAARLTTPFVSEFPYYRDVTTDYWAYVPIEGFRMRTFLLPTQTGYFYPEQPITRQQAAMYLSETLDLKWLNLAPEEVESTLAVYHLDMANRSEPERYHLARSLYAGFLFPQFNQPGQTLALNEPLSRLDALRMIYRRALMEEEDSQIRQKQVRRIPAGVSLPMTPTAALALEQLAVGSGLFFSLVNDIDVSVLQQTLPRGTRLHGTVTQIHQETRVAQVSFDRLSTPAGEFFQLSGLLELPFAPQSSGKPASKTFIVPGETFTLLSQP